MLDTLRGLPRLTYLAKMLPTMSLPPVARLILVALASAASARAELLATFSGPGGASDTRLDRLPAIYVQSGQPAATFLAPGKFSVTWTGTLVLEARSRLNFSFEGDGAASLKIGGQTVLDESGALGQAKMETLRLNPGEHPIEITFTSKDDGSGRFRLFWEERAFPRQSVPATSFKTDAQPEGETLRRGRELFATHQCTACHAPAKPIDPLRTPELAVSAPQLAGIGSRVTQEWLTRWIASPSTLKHTTTMPAMVNHRTAEGAQTAADIAAYLATLRDPAREGDKADAQGAHQGTTQEPAQKPQAAELTRPAQATPGGGLFHQLGCVGCHTLPGENAQDFENHRIPLNNLATKYRPGVLAEFLKNPRAHAPAIKMPDFALTAAEASELAAFLTQASTGKHTPDPAEFPPGDATRGMAAVKALACASCHNDLPAEAAAPANHAPTLAAILGKDWKQSGCLSDSGTKHPQFPQLSQGDRAALAAYATAGAPALDQSVPAEFAKSYITSHRCTTCHALDRRPAALDSLHPQSLPFATPADTHVDQSRPALTFTGEMLHASFIEKMLDGKALPRPRPWLAMRMPAFHDHPRALATGIAHQHGIIPSTPDERPKFDNPQELATTGATIASSQGGFACNICHAIGSDKPTAVFEAEGINLALTQQRLRYEFFQRWLDDPARVHPATKMPKFTQDGKSPLPYFNNDPRKQFDALWEYLHSVKAEN